MKGKYLQRIGALVFSVLMLIGVAFVSSSNAQAQGRRRVVIVRPNPYRFHRPFGFGHRGRWDYLYGRDLWGYDPWSPFGSRYRQYVFDNSDKAVKQAKSYNPERSHYYHDSGFGNFAEVYRSGFSRGYQDGYRVGGNQRAS
jgi:hypothetical protein